VALTLSDPFCVDRHRDTFRALIRDHVDILFANEAEIVSLTQAADFDGAVRMIQPEVEIAALTRSELGSVVIGEGRVISVPAIHVDKLVDTTGAGDLYAGGFLWGLTEGRDLRTCARIGGLCAAEVIQHIGGRPEADLAGLVRSAGL
jgi:sugar/nucleoside kinase (ribokinase family)